MCRTCLYRKPLPSTCAGQSQCEKLIILIGTHNGTASIPASDLSSSGLSAQCEKLPQHKLYLDTKAIRQVHDITARQGFDRVSVFVGW